jgi:hypothetical protein
MLCDTCRNIDFDLLLPSENAHGAYKHHASFDKLKEAAALGCELCTLISITHEKNIKEISEQILKYIRTKAIYEP